ncbi:hypothetical protein CsSME_00020882 [Camellia sinensis var. sinensis]
MFGSSKMLFKSKTFKILLHCRSRTNPNMYKGSVHHINGVYNFFCNTTESPKIDDSPTIPESPELPTWVKFSEKTNPQLENPDEDFVLPSVSYWIDNHKLHHQTTHIKIKSIVSDIIDSDLNKISKVLKNRFQSPDDVIQALNCCCCSVDLSESVVEQILKRFSNDWIPAFGFFNWGKFQMGFEYSGELYNSMVDILGKCKKFEVMRELVEEMDQFEGYITLITMTKVMRRFAKAYRYEDAIEAFRRIERFGLSKDVEAMNALMDALVKENSVEHAQDVYLEFKNCIPPNSHTLNVLIHGWCKVRQMERARETMGDMEKLGFHPNVISYTCFVEAYCREKDFRKVDVILEEMQEKGCPPNAVTYTIVMHALGKAKEIGEALKVYEKMKKDGCVLDSPFYSSMIYILSNAGRLKDAREVLDDMPNRGVIPDVLTYNTMISAACEHSQEENALKLLQEMEKNQCKPDLKTYAPLLKMCCRKKRMKVLFFLLKHMFENDVSLDLGTYSLLVRGLCKSGKLEHACSFFEETVLRGFVPKVSIYEMLREELKRKGMEKAKEQVEELMLQARSERIM